MYIYESHLSGLYASEMYLDYDELYCEQCGDSDWLIGYADTKKEAWDLLTNYTDIDDSGGYSYDYIQTFINTNWEE